MEFQAGHFAKILPEYLNSITIGTHGHLMGSTHCPQIQFSPSTVNRLQPCRYSCFTSLFRETDTSHADINSSPNLKIIFVPGTFGMFAAS